MGQLAAGLALQARAPTPPRGAGLSGTQPEPEPAVCAGPLGASFIPRVSSGVGFTGDGVCAADTRLGERAGELGVVVGVFGSRQRVTAARRAAPSRRCK